MQGLKKIEIKIQKLKNEIENNNKKISELTKNNSILNEDLKKIEKIYVKAKDIENELAEILNTEKIKKSNNIETAYE